MIQLLSEHDVTRVRHGVDLVRLMNAALRVRSARAGVRPARTVVSAGPGQAFFGVMPADVPAREAALVESGDIVCGISGGRFAAGLGVAAPSASSWLQSRCKPAECHRDRQRGDRCRALRRDAMKPSGIGP